MHAPGPSPRVLAVALFPTPLLGPRPNFQPPIPHMVERDLFDGHIRDAVIVDDIIDETSCLIECETREDADAMGVTRVTGWGTARAAVAVFIDSSVFERMVGLHRRGDVFICFSCLFFKSMILIMLLNLSIVV